MSILRNFFPILAAHILLATPLCAHQDAANAPAILEEATTAREAITLGDRFMQEARNILSHDFHDAGAAYQKALTLAPENTSIRAEALLGLGWVANSNHDFQAGRDWCLQALEISPALVSAHSLIGDGAVELGNYEEALEHYQKALDLSEDLSTLSRAAHLLWLTGNNEKAHELMRSAIESGGPYPENVAWCHAELALMFLHSGRLEEAENEAETALALAPENPRALMAMGLILSARENYPEAISRFEQSIAINPTHDALAPLPLLYELTGQDSQAAAATQAVIDFHQSHQHADGEKAATEGHTHTGSHELALFLADQNRDLPLALKEATECYRAYPNVKTADALAWCHFQNGDYSQAQKLLTVALSQDTPLAPFHYHAGLIFSALNNHSKAREHLEKALALNPHFHPQQAPNARQVLADLTKNPSFRPKTTEKSQ